MFARTSSALTSTLIPSPLKEGCGHPIRRRPGFRTERRLVLLLCPANGTIVIIIVVVSIPARFINDVDIFESQVLPVRYTLQVDFPRRACHSADLFLRCVDMKMVMCQLPSLIAIQYS